MTQLVREFAFTFLAWFVPFVVSVCVFRLRDTHRPLFEIIMSLTLTTNTALLGLAYLRRVSGNFLTRAVRIGVTWMIANWLFDFVMFSSGPMQMPLHRYVLEIAGAYLVIPVITMALGMAIKIGARGKLAASAPRLG
jgi:uncharacterized membrane protein YpjA